MVLKWLIFLQLAMLPSAAGAAGPTLSLAVHFPEGNATISRVEMDNLAQMVCVLRGRSLEVILIVGHADAHENDAESLARRRANEVQQALVGMGVSLEKTVVESKGSRQPVVVVDSEQRDANRRVDVEALNLPIDESSATCELLWKHQLLALDANRAAVVAKSLVRHDGLKVTTPFLVAIHEKRVDLVVALLGPDSGLALNTKDRKMLIEVAASTGNPDMIRAFMNTKPQSEDWPSLTKALSNVACSSASDLAKLETARIFLDSGAEPNDKSEYPPLACAAMHNHMVLLELLLAAGADPNQPEGLLVNAGSHREIVFRLLRAGANPLARSSNKWRGEGRTLFHTFRLETPADVGWLVSLGLDINTADRAGVTPLDIAAGYANEAVLESMIHAGAIINSKLDGRLLSEAQRNPTALTWLVRRGLLLKDQGNLLTAVAAKGESMLPALAALIKRGLDINQRDRAGETALAAAILNYHPAVVRALLEAGADPTNVRQQMSAIQVAQSLSARDQPIECFDCFFTSAASREETLSPRLLRLKNEILEILRAK